jgi:hypothetical protein
LYDSDAEALIRLIDERNAGRLSKDNIPTWGNTEEASEQIESAVDERESRSHGFNTRSKSRDKRHKSSMALNDVATATGSSSSGIEAGSLAKQSSGMIGNQTFNKALDVYEKKMNIGKSRQRSVRSRLEEDDSESDDVDNDSRPAKRQQSAAGCSRSQHTDKMNTGKSKRRRIGSMSEEDDSVSVEEGKDSRPAKRQQFATDFRTLDVGMGSSAGVCAGGDAGDKSDGDINVEFSMQKGRIKRAMINKLKVAEIRRCLIERGLDSKGKKTELKRRLVAALKTEATAVGHMRKGENMGKGRRRSIRSMIEDDDSESDEEENDSRPAKRHQGAAGCSGSQYTEKMSTGKSKRKSFRGMSEEDESVGEEGGHESRPLKRQQVVEGRGGSLKDVEGSRRSGQVAEGHIRSQQFAEGRSR